MAKIKVSREELQNALNEISSRSTRSDFVNIEISETNLRLSDTDDYNNIIEAILFRDKNLEAQFRYSERLMFMKNKK